MFQWRSPGETVTTFGSDRSGSANPRTAASDAGGENTRGFVVTRTTLLRTSSDMATGSLEVSAVRSQSRY